MPLCSELLDTSLGPARAHLDRAESPVCTLVLGHGAGGGITARDLAALAAALPAYGVTVVRVEQPWRVAGKRVAPPPRALDTAWRAVVPALRDRGRLTGPLVVGGRSAGARVACRTGRDVGASACLSLAFPLHPPGRPERSRLPELLAVGLPTLVVQGERDVFGAPPEFPPEVGVRALPGADHAFAVPRGVRLPGPDQDGVLDMLVVTVAGWLATLA